MYCLYTGKHKISVKRYLTPVKTQLLQYNATLNKMLLYHSHQIKNHEYVVVISRQCPFGADKAVQISRAVVLIKEHNPNFAAKKCKIAI